MTSVATNGGRPALRPGRIQGSVNVASEHGEHGADDPDDIFSGKDILITGGTGSFGRLYVRTLLARFRPRRLIIYSRDEVKQFEMARECTDECMRFFIGDVRDRERLVQAMRGVDYVIHAAALKQVPAAEYNPMECIKTNVHGAENVIHAALANDVERVIGLSSDKATNPINLYGATKLAADKLFVAANNMAGGHRTRFSAVRYGNVVGSRGSVVPFFQSLIERGADHLPITDSGMTRFWITLDQAVAFVQGAFRRMQGGEIFVPKLPSVRVTDLAHAMAPHLAQKIVGIRPGEKLHELMCPADHSHLTLEFCNHYVMTPTIRFVGTVDFTIDPSGDRGRLVHPGFEYQSGTNPHFLQAAEIVALNRPAAIA